MSVELRHRYSFSFYPDCICFLGSNISVACSSLTGLVWSGQITLFNPNLELIWSVQVPAGVAAIAERKSNENKQNSHIEINNNKDVNSSSELWDKVGLFCGLDNGEIRLVNDIGYERGVWKIHEGVTALHTNDFNKNVLISAGVEGYVGIWNVCTGSKDVVQVHTGPVQSVRMLDENSFLSSSRGLIIRHDIRTDAIDTCHVELNAMCFSENVTTEGTFYTGFEDGTISLFDRRNLTKSISGNKLHDSSVRNIELFDRFVVTTSDDCSWKVHSSDLITKCSTSGDDFTRGLAVSENNVYVGSWDKHVSNYKCKI